MTKMAKESPRSYTKLRLSQAINPLEWWRHKREFSGLAMMFVGLFSFVSGFRQVKGKFTEEMIVAGMKNTQHYIRNPAQMIGGLITLGGGTQLMMAVDSDKGWRNFGLIQMLRLATLPNSISTRFSQSEQGAEWYLGAQGVLQAKNIFAASVGGAEKLKDGTVVNHEEIRKQAEEKEKQEKALRKAQKAKEREKRRSPKHTGKEKEGAADVPAAVEKGAPEHSSGHSVGHSAARPAGHSAGDYPDAQVAKHAPLPQVSALQMHARAMPERVAAQEAAPAAG
jgi:hypothetical protein